MTNIHAKQGLQTVGGLGCAGRGQAAGRTAETQSSKSTSSSSASSSPASTITPRRSPGPWFLAGAPSKLSIRPASTSTRPPRCNDFQLFERLKLSAGLGAYPPYCPHRFLCSGVPTSRIAHHVVGERFGASRNVVLPRFFLAHRLGRPLERSEIAWGCLWVRLGCARGQNKIAFNRDSRVFAVFSAPLRPSPDPHTPP